MSSGSSIGHLHLGLVEWDQDQLTSQGFTMCSISCRCFAVFVLVFAFWISIDICGVRCIGAWYGVLRLNETNVAWCVYSPQFTMVALVSLWVWWITYEDTFNGLVVDFQVGALLQYKCLTPDLTSVRDSVSCHSKPWMESSLSGTSRGCDSSCMLKWVHIHPKDLLVSQGLSIWI